jgi:hemerythrin
MGSQWRQGLSVGNDLIDADHKYLIEIINLVDHGLQAKNKVELTESLDNLSRYSKVHFAREELFAQAVAYPQAAQLHESHDALVKGLDQVKLEIGEEWAAASLDHFGTFLRDWLINHVIKEDMLLKPYFKKHSPRFDPR